VCRVCRPWLFTVLGIIGDVVLVISPVFIWPPDPKVFGAAQPSPPAQPARARFRRSTRRHGAAAWAGGQLASPLLLVGTAAAAGVLAHRPAVLPFARHHRGLTNFIPFSGLFWGPSALIFAATMSTSAVLLTIGREPDRQVEGNVITPYSRSARVPMPPALACSPIVVFDCFVACSEFSSLFLCGCLMMLV
jgi:hypothetical protein